MASGGREEFVSQRPAVKLWDSAQPQKDEHETEDNLEASPLVTSRTDCRKHPDHSEFIPVADFGVDKVGSVPPWTSKEEVRDLVLTLAGLVVRIVGTFISQGRPDSRYPFSNRRGKSYEFSGSGWILFPPRSKEGMCLCGFCRGKGIKKTFWEMEIHTALHVIFDDIEAEHCEVVLFDEYPHKRGTHRLVGSKVNRLSANWDRSVLWCYTCDKDLVRQLRDILHESHEIANGMDQRAREWCEGSIGAEDSVVRQRVAELGRQIHKINDTAANHTSEDHNKDESVKLRGMKLGQRIRRVFGRGNQLPDDAIRDNVQALQLPDDAIRDNVQALLSDPSLPRGQVYVISHPHGCMKYVTVGHRQRNVEDGWGPVTYEVATCPGSSGGLALTLPSVVDILLDKELEKWRPCDGEDWREMRCVSHSRARSSAVGLSVGGMWSLW